MKISVRTYFFVFIGALLSACDSSEPVMDNESHERALSFAANVDDSGFTRTYNNSTRDAHTRIQPFFYTRAGLEDTYKGFLVRTMKTMPDNSRQTVMDNYETWFDATNRWYYDGVTNGSGVEQTIKYWDENATSYTFAAVTPVPNRKDNTSFAYKDTKVTIGDDGNITFESVKGNISCDDSGNSANAPDWMVARTVRTNAASVTDDDALDAAHMFHLDAGQQPTKVAGSLYATVPMNFHHIMAKVDFRAYSESGSILLKSFKVMLPDDNTDKIINQGDYSTAISPATGKPVGWTNTSAEVNSYQDPKRFGDYTYLEAKTVPKGKENAALLASHVQIPHTWLSSGRVLNVRCVTTDDRELTGTITLTKDNNGAVDGDKSGWEQNKHYTYLLKINAVGTNEVILFSVDMETWKWVLGNTFEDEEHNW